MNDTTDSQSGDSLKKRLLFQNFTLLLGCVFFQFALHRIFVLPQLGGTVLTNLKIYALALGLGFASDLWASVLLVVPLSVLLGAVLPRRTLSAALAGFLILIGFLLAGHVPYVDFFHVTFRRLHLEYVFDSSFLASSFNAIMQPRSAVQFLGGVACAVFFLASRFRSRFQRALSLRWGATFLPVVLALAFGILANYLSTKYTRKFDLNDRLTQNVVVAFFIDAAEHQTRKNVLGLSTLDLQHLKSDLPASKNLESRPLFSPQMSLLANGFAESNSPSQHYLKNILVHLKSEFTPDKLKQDQRYFFVFLMESSRAVESHLLFPELKGNMPNLDSIVAENSLAFARGFSTGTVSRSGAESTVCNALSSVYFNAMRNSPLATPQCAAEILQPALAAQNIPANFFWVHGGYPTFDGQGDFWRRNHFSAPLNILSLKDLPSTGWGLSDRAFFRQSQTWLDAHNHEQKTGLTFATFATISNHTAWHLPEDASPEVVLFAKTSPYPNFSTTRYADEAVFEFIQNLKQKHIWEKSVVAFVGDHGMEEPSEIPGGYFGFGNSPEQDRKSARLLTNVYFALSGGLVEQAAAQCRTEQNCPPQGALLFQNAVSQSDLLPTFSEILGETEHPFFGVSLFHERRKFQVFADLGEQIYVPGPSRQEGERVYDKSAFFAAQNLQNSDVSLRAFYMLYLFQTQSGDFSRQLRANNTVHVK